MEKVLYIGPYAYTKKMLEDELQFQKWMLEDCNETGDGYPEFHKQEIELYSQLLVQYKEIYEGGN